jgi:hypothetical protein
MLVFWPYSVFGQNHLCVKMRLIGIPLSEWGQKIRPGSQKNFKFPVSRPDDVSFRPDIRQTSIMCPDDVLLLSGHLHRIEKLLCQLAPSGRFSSTSERLSVLERFTDSFQVQEREDQWTVRTSNSSGPDAGASYMVTADSTSTVRMSHPHGPDSRASDMEIACWSLAVRTFLPHGPDWRSLLWKLLAADVRPSGRSSHPVRTMFLYRKDFYPKILKNPVVQLFVRTAPRHIFSWRPFWPPSY